MIDVVGMDEWRIVVPLRFRRFNHGHLPQRDCPEVDDRGYHMGTRPSSWGTTTVRGPSFGITRSDTVKVALIREDIDDTAPLFATSSDTAVLTVITPNGGPLAADGELQVHGVATGTAMLEIRLGSLTGPVLARADVRVHSLLTVPLVPHLVQVDSSTTVGTRPAVDIDAMVRRVRAIWRPCGIHFDLDPVINVPPTQLPTNHLNLVDSDSDADTQAVLGLDNRAESINWYIIPEFIPNADGSSTVGIGISRQWAAPGGPTGVILAARANGNPRDPEFAARTLAHEIGHFFRLHHVQEHHNDDPVKDTYGRRQLMFPLSRLNGGTGGVAVPRFDNVGYGDHVRGCLLTMKEHAHHSTDGECFTARNAIRSNNWF